MGNLLARTEEEVNLAAIDRWSWAHLTTGFALGTLHVRPSIAIGLMAGWELLEPEIEQAYPGLFPNPNRESYRNQLADVVVGVVGYAAARLLLGG